MLTLHGNIVVYPLDAERGNVMCVFGSEEHV